MVVLAGLAAYVARIPLSPTTATFWTCAHLRVSGGGVNSREDIVFGEPAEQTSYGDKLRVHLRGRDGVFQSRDGCR